MSNSKKPKYLVLFYGVSSGTNGENLGSDEQDLVTLIYLVFNTEDNQVNLILEVSMIDGQMVQNCRVYTPFFIIYRPHLS